MSLMKKRWLLPILSSALALPFVAAAVPGTIGTVWNKILSVGNLSFLGYSDGSLVVGFTRILLWILIFAVFFAVIIGLGGEKGTAPMKFFNRGQAAVIAGVIATIAAIFLPAEVILATGTGWATAIALILIGGPIVGIGYLLITIPGRGKETKATVLVKIVLCFLLFWILSAMKYHVGRLV